MIEINNVTFHYSMQGGQDTPPALSEVSLRIDEGETVAIIGHNGSGKSTLVKLIAAILHPTNGNIVVDGIPTIAKDDRLWTLRQHVGIVFQNPDDQLVANTVIDEIAFGPENLGLPLAEIDERVQEAIALLGLEEYANVEISKLSVGQKQRVTIAGILAMRPRYLLLDEPTTMISGQSARNLLETVQRLARERNITVIHITHFMHEITDFQRVIVMHEGKVLMDGTPATIFAQPDALQDIGLDVPMVTRLAQRLREQGWTSVPEVVTSINQLNGAFSNQIEGTESATPEAGRKKETSIPPEADKSARSHAGSGDLYGEGGVMGGTRRFNGEGIFELKDVRYTYLRDTPFATEALRGLTLTIHEGQTVALVGPTKSGKSTAVDLLAGLVKPAAGMFLFEGRDTGTPPSKRRASSPPTTSDAARGAEDTLQAAVGVVFQSPESQIFEDTVGKDVSFGPRLKKVPLAESRRLVQESLEAVGLPYEDFRTRYTYALSGGQKRRVAIAGVLALQPRVIAFDEPTAGLDPGGRHDLLSLIATLKQRHNLTIVYTSSGLDDVIDLAATIYILDQGHVAFSGTPREILAHAEQLQMLDIALPEAAQIALALRAVFPELPTDVLNLTELEAAIQQAAKRSREMGVQREV